MKDVTCFIEIQQVAGIFNKDGSCSLTSIHFQRLFFSKPCHLWVLTFIYPTRALKLIYPTKFNVISRLNVLLMTLSLLTTMMSFFVCFLHKPQWIIHFFIFMNTKEQQVATWMLEIKWCFNIYSMIFLCCTKYKTHLKLILFKIRFIMLQQQYSNQSWFRCKEIDCCHYDG